MELRVTSDRRRHGRRRNRGTQRICGRTNTLPQQRRSQFSARARTRFPHSDTPGFGETYTRAHTPRSLIHCPRPAPPGSRTCPARTRTTRPLPVLATCSPPGSSPTNTRTHAHHLDTSQTHPRPWPDYTQVGPWPYNG